MNKKREIKLVNKIKHLLRQLNCPKYGHRFGPKKYEFYEHMVALTVRWFCNLSYRMTVKLLDLFGIRCPSKSALQYNSNKISNSLWNNIFELTSGNSHSIVALDATGFSRTNPSYHYLKRIDGKIPKMYAKLSAVFDTENKKFCAAKTRVTPAHDIKDAKVLIKRVKTKTLVADKGYDANHIHEFCSKRNIEAHIPLRKKGKAKHHMMNRRRLSVKNFNEDIYHRRELIESGFGSVKRKFGSSVKSKKAKTIRNDIYGRLLCHNIFCFYRLLGQSRVVSKVYKD